MNLESRVKELNRMILDGQALDAFEKFYAEDVVMQEDADEPFRGKDTNREREKEFFGNVTELREARVESVAVNEDDGVAMVEWHFDYTHADWGDVEYDQVARQVWEDGKIVHERFYKAV